MCPQGGRYKAIKGQNGSGGAKERKSQAERFPHPPTQKPAPSPAAMSRGVSRVKGIRAARLRNLGGTTDFSVP